MKLLQVLVGLVIAAVVGVPLLMALAGALLVLLGFVAVVFAVIASAFGMA